MKDGRTHLAHKAEHAVDLDTGALPAVTVQGADVGDTASVIETAIMAAEQILRSPSVRSSEPLGAREPRVARPTTCTACGVALNTIVSAC